MVRASAERWRERLARQPTRFLHAEYPDLLRQAAAGLARRVSVPADTLVFLSNTTEAVNAVLRSRRLSAGDEILLLDQAYGAVRQAARFVAETAGARVVEAAVPFPGTEPDDVVRRVADAITARTRLAVLDHVTSTGALVLPIEAMVRACRSRGVPVLVDGAHAPGQVPLDLGAIGAEWYAGNLHKWWFAPTGSAFLHARPDAQDGLHPASISHGLGSGFIAEFDWTGTRDPAPYLAVTDALAFADRLGGAALQARNASLARTGATLVANHLGTEAAPLCLPGGAMALARLPDDAGPATLDGALAFRARLIAHRLDAPVVALAGRLWIRLSAQIYNAIEDWDRASRVIARVLERGEPDATGSTG